MSLLKKDIKLFKLHKRLKKIRKKDDCQVLEFYFT